MSVVRIRLSPYPILRLITLGMVLMTGIASLAHAQQANPPAPAPYTSAEEANRAIAKATDEIARAEEKYRTEERACYRKFLTTACLDAAASRRRAALANWRTVVVEAKAWLRKDKADRRDQALAQRRLEDDIDSRDRAQEVKAREAAIDRKRISSEERQRQAQQSEAAVPDTQRLKSARQLQQR